jgi:hypothetical protein
MCAGLQRFLNDIQRILLITKVKPRNTGRRSAKDCGEYWEAAGASWPERAIYWHELSSHGSKVWDIATRVFTTPMPKECPGKITKSHLRVANRQRSSVSLPPNALH